MGREHDLLMRRLKYDNERFQEELEELKSSSKLFYESELDEIRFSEKLFGIALKQTNYGVMSYE